jgi:hypothetical protein
MFGRLKSIFSGKRQRQGASVHNVGGVAAPNSARRKLVPDDAKYIEAALTNLAGVGLKLTHPLQATAEKIAAQWQGISFSADPTPADWIGIALSAEPGHFGNSIFLPDHCYDVAGLGDYSGMIASIISLARDAWPVESIDVKNTHRPGAAIEWHQPVTVTITAKPEVAPFQLLHAKDFDWSIVFRLNERLPKGAAGRFAIFLDGNATIVFLTPEEIQRLNLLRGFEFFYEENPEGLGTPA